MVIWITVNLCLSTLALAFLLLNRRAPHRLRFSLSFAAMVAWLVPWKLLSGKLPTLFSTQFIQGSNSLYEDNSFTVLLPIMDGLDVINRSALSPLVVDKGVLFFTGLLLIGLGLFCWHVIRHSLTLSSLLNNCQDGNWAWEKIGLPELSGKMPLIVQTEIYGAFNSGLLKPRI